MKITYWHGTMFNEPQAFIYPFIDQADNEDSNIHAYIYVSSHFNNLALSTWFRLTRVVELDQAEKLAQAFAIIPEVLARMKKEPDSLPYKEGR